MSILKHNDEILDAFQKYREEDGKKDKIKGIIGAIILEDMKGNSFLLSRDDSGLADEEVYGALTMLAKEIKAHETKEKT